jgi:hypothetical protein
MLSSLKNAEEGQDLFLGNIFLLVQKIHNFLFIIFFFIIKRQIVFAWHYI